MERGKEQMDREEDGKASNITQYIQTPTTSSSGSRNKKQLSFETGLRSGYNLTFHGVRTCAQLWSKNI